MTVSKVPSSDRVWPNATSIAQLPNVAAATIQSGLLQAGDLCPVTGGALYICQTATLGAGAWLPISAGGVLWSWNQIDVSQFAAKVSLGIGANIAGLTLTAVAGGPNGTLLRIGSTELNNGGVVFPINFVFPRRYVIEATFRECLFTDVANAGRNMFGLTLVAENTYANIIAMTTGNNTAALPDMMLNQVAISAGAPFGPALTQNALVAGAYTPAFGAPQSGFAVRYTVSTARPCAAQPEISVGFEGSGGTTTSPSVSRAYGNSFSGVAYPGTWAGKTLNALGVLVGNQGGVTTAWTADIESLQVVLHPDDVPG